MPTQLTLSEPIINWTWFCELTLHEDQTVTVNKYYRLHRFNPDQGADDHPVCQGTIEKMDEADGRILQRVWFNYNGTRYFAPVRNPKHIFDYK